MMGWMTVPCPEIGNTADYLYSGESGGDEGVLGTAEFEMPGDLQTKTASRQQDTGLAPQKVIPVENTGLGVTIYH